MTPRPMRADDEPAVRKLYAKGHPFWPPRPEPWYVTYPTLVMEMDGAILGFTSFAIGEITGLRVVQGADLVVDLTYRGAGIGIALHRARLALWAAIGATWFSGVTQPDNTAMQRIFLACGHHACQPIRRYYPDGGDGVIYAGAI